MGIEKHTFLNERILKINHCMNSEPKDYDGAALAMREFAGRLARYYHKKHVDAYMNYGVDDEYYYFTVRRLQSGRAVSNLKEMGWLKDEFICEKLKCMIDQGNRVAHPEKGLLNTYMVQECYNSLNYIIESFIKEFPTDREYVNTLKGEILKFENGSKYGKDILNPVCKFDNVIGRRFENTWFVEDDIVDHNNVIRTKNGEALILKADYIGKGVRCVVKSKSQDGYIEGKYTIKENDLISNDIKKDNVTLKFNPDYLDPRTGKKESVLIASVNVTNRYDYKYEWWFVEEQRLFKENTHIITIRPYMEGKNIEFRAVNEGDEKKILSVVFGPITKEHITKEPLFKRGNNISTSNSESELIQKVVSKENVEPVLSRTQSAVDNIAKLPELTGQAKIEPNFKSKEYDLFPLIVSSIENSNINSQQQGLHFKWGFVKKDETFIPLYDGYEFKCRLDKGVGKVYRCEISCDGYSGKIISNSYHLLSKDDFLLPLVGNASITLELCNKEPYHNVIVLKAKFLNNNLNDKPNYTWVSGDKRIDSGSNSRYIISEKDIGTTFTCEISHPKRKGVIITDPFLVTSDMFKGLTEKEMEQNYIESKNCEENKSDSNLSTIESIHDSILKSVENFVAANSLKTELFSTLTQPSKKEDMDVFYMIDGKIYSYQEAKKQKRFDPDEGDRKIVRWLNEDGSMSNDEPSNEEIKRYIKNYKTPKNPGKIASVLFATYIKEKLSIEQLELLSGHRLSVKRSKYNIACHLLSMLMNISFIIYLIYGHYICIIATALIYISRFASLFNERNEKKSNKKLLYLCLDGLGILSCAILYELTTLSVQMCEFIGVIGALVGIITHCLYLLHIDFREYMIL